MILGEVRRYLRDNNSIRVSRSLRDTAYKAIYAREGLTRKNAREPTLMEIAQEIGISKEDITYALDAIQSPVSLYEPIYTDGGDPLYVMDQIKDKKSSEENWVEEISLREAMNRLPDQDRLILSMRAIEDMSYQEIGDALQLQPGTVKSRISRAREKIRRSLDGNFFEGSSSRKGKGGMRS